MKTRLLYFLLFGIGCFCSSCNTNIDVEAWQTEITAPIASTELSLANIVGPKNYSTGDSGDISLVFSSKLYDAKGLDFFDIPEKEDITSVSLETIRLSNNTLTTSILLGDAYPLAKLLNGRDVTLEPLTLIDAGKAEVNAQAFFTSAYLESGWMLIEIVNGFPVELDTLQFALTNQSDGSLVARRVFYDIPAGSSVIDSVDMSGVYAEGLMNGVLEKVVSAASEGKVTIYAKDALTMNVSVKDLKAETATAVFPAQDLINLDQNWRYDFGGPRIKEMRIESGNLKLRVVSSINETIYVTFEAPGLSQNGLPVVRNIIVPAAKNGTLTETEIVDLKGVEVNLRGKASQGFVEENSLNYKMKASIKYSGELKTISKTDSIFVSVGLEKLVPEYALGYFDQINETVGPSSIYLDAFRNLDGEFDLDNVQFDLAIFNSVGIDAQLNFGEILSTSKTGSTVKMTADLFSTGIRVKRAEDLSRPFKQTFTFNNDNSNVDQFIENLPKNIGYQLNLLTNPDGNTSNFQDFIYSDSRISANLNMTIPLKIQTDGLIMTDTVAMDFSGYEEIAGLKNAELNLISYNYYPLEAKVQFIMLDAENKVIDTLFNNKEEFAQPGKFDGFGERIIEPSKSVFSTSLPKKDFDYIMKHAKKAIIKVTFDTYNTDHKTIYDDYRFEIKLTGNFIYENSPEF